MSVRRPISTPRRRGNSRSSTATANRPVKAGTAAQSVAPARPNGRQFELKAGEQIVTHDQIAQAAYFLWKQRGGNDVVNWLEAESMLRRRAAQR